MTDENPNLPKASVKSLEKPQSAEKKGQSKGASLFILLVLVLITAGLAGFSLWQNHQLKAQSELTSVHFIEQLTNIESQLSLIEAKASSFENRLSELSKLNQSQIKTLGQKVNDSNEQLQKKLSTLEQQQERRVRLGYNQSAENAIFEAMAIAFRKLHFEKNPADTIELLELVIKTYCEPPAKASLLPVCLGLEADRAKLTHLALPNTNRILQELTSIQNQLTSHHQNLESILKKGNLEPNQQATRSYRSFENWGERFDYFLGQMSGFFQKHFVKIHHIDESQPIRMSVDQKLYLSQNIVLLLQQAKSACLSKDQALFEQSLTEAIQAYSQLLGNTQNDSLNHIQTLKNLSSITLAPAMPRLSATYAALSEITRTPKEADAESN